MDEISSIAVIGAGAMGAGIAALAANAGAEVRLLDIDPLRAEEGIARELRTGGLANATIAKRIRTGSSVADLAVLAETDWIIEAAAERLDAKQSIFRAVNAARKAASVVSSTTSTIPLSKLTEGMSANFTSRFLVTHFFNPPRLMRLVEMVTGPTTALEATEAVTAFVRRIGSSAVQCRDTPGFIANRIGGFWMGVVLEEAIAAQLDIEEADAAIAVLFGAQKGVFGLVDLLGIDVLTDVWRSLHSALPADDDMHALAPEPPLIADMIVKGRTGRKSGAGFGRRLSDGTFETLDLANNAYRPTRIVPARPDPASLLFGSTLISRFATRATTRTLAYATSLIPEVAQSPDLIDRAMRDGYGWKHGPFEMIDRFGAALLRDEMVRQHRPVPPLLHEAAMGRLFYGA